MSAQTPEGSALDAAAVRERVLDLRDRLDAVREYRSVGDAMGVTAALVHARSLVDGLLGSLERAATRKLTTLPLRIVCNPDGHPVNLRESLARWLRAYPPPGVLDARPLDWQFEPLGTVTAPWPYVRGSAVAQGAPDAKEAGDEFEPC